ncbi:hypothetical protein BBF96_14125 [Anoxybacter fermentans]|uniref:Major facilitator superfamily (MFS) profile domain-containing protein n=1 Tax=Anoxybacter fermentans TaxID=1323375 RepID=A0A3S9T1J1_9FIRM|nr:MFS transporter [Anoxybacter fermentans]AZR74424.1 hypothetical protein BBF96_14125 [Anoxybacter fermentans]
MEQWKKNLYVLWFGTFVAAVSFSLVTPFLPLFLKEELKVINNIEIWAGLLVSASFVTSAIMSPIWGALADRYGRKIMIIRSGLGIGLTYILSAFVHNIYLFLFLRILMGTLSGFIPSSIALVATNTPEKEISRSLGILQTGIAAGGVTGPLLGGLLSYWFGIRESIFIGGVVILLGTILVIFGVKETAVCSTEKTNILRDLKIGFSNRQLMISLLILMGVQAGMNMIQPILPLYIEKISPIGMDISLVTGIAFSLIGIATILAAPRWSAKAEEIGFKTVLILGLFGGAILNLFQLLYANVYLFCSLRFIFGVSIAGVIPALNSMIAKSVDVNFRGRAFGISNSFNQFGLAAGPVLGGVIGKIGGLKSPFIVASVIFMLAAVYINADKRRKVELKVI